MINIFHCVFWHHSNGSMSIASIFQEVKVVAELIFRIFGSWVTKNSTCTSAHMRLAARIYICPRGCLKRVRGVGRIDVDTIRAVVPEDIDCCNYSFYKKFNFSPGMASAPRGCV